MRRALSCSTALTLLACSCEPTPTRSNADSPAERADLPSPPQPPANTFVAPNADELATLATALAGHLTAAREATDAAARSAALERAVQIVPFDANTLAERGRAEVDAGHLTDAVLSFELALRNADNVADTDNVAHVTLRAALLVELGAAVEVMGNRTRAAELYQSSMALHPNELAAARLAALTGGVEVVSHDACAWTQHGPAPAELCPAYVQARGAPPNTCAYVHPTLELDADTKVAVFSHLDPGTAIEVFVVNAIIAGVWYSSPLTWVSHPEAAHADENVAQLDMRLEQLAPDRKPQVVLEWTLEQRSVDPAKDTLVTHTSTNLGVLSVSTPDPRWWLGLRTASSHSERLVSDSSEPKPTQTSVALTWMPKSGEFELLRTEHAPSATLGKFALGTYRVLCPSEIDGS